MTTLSNDSRCLIPSEPRERVCDFNGHEWTPAGGGLEICMVCESERWADDDRLEDEHHA